MTLEESRTLRRVTNDVLRVLIVSPQLFQASNIGQRAMVEQ